MWEGDPGSPRSAGINMTSVFLGVARLLPRYYRLSGQHMGKAISTAFVAHFSISKIPAEHSSSLLSEQRSKSVTRRTNEENVSTQIPSQ